MAQQILQTLLFNIESNTAQLKQGLDQAKSQISSFGKGVQQIGNLIKSAFVATAIIGAAKEVFNFANEIDSIIGKIDDLGNSLNLALDAGKAKAIADVFEVDIDKVITAANSAAKNFGVSFSDALTLTQQGLSLAGTESQKYLKSLEANSAAYASAGGTAEEYFTVVTNGYRNSTEFEKQLKDGVTDIGVSWSELNGQMNDGQIIQQRLINSSAELNSVWASLFDGTGDVVDNIKIAFNEIAAKSIKAIISGAIQLANYFIELYNKSILFRGVIQAVVLNFQLMWNTVKAIGTTLIDAFTNAGALLKAVLTGNFEAIPEIIKKAFDDSVANATDFATGTADAFKDGVQAVLFAEPIKLISETEAVQQGIKAGNAIKKGIASTNVYGAVNSRSNISDVDISQVSLQQPANIDSKLIMDSLTEVSTATADVNSQMSALDTQISDTLTGTLVNSLGDASDALINFNDKSEDSFGNFVRSMLKGVKDIVFGLLAQAIAGMVANETSKAGIIGLAVAGAGVAAISSMFDSQVFSKFANGGVSTGGVALVGERGRELVTLPSGSRVANNFQTERMLGNTNSGSSSIMGMLRGEDIYFSYNEVARRRGGSKG